MRIERKGNGDVNGDRDGDGWGLEVEGSRLLGFKGVLLRLGRGVGEEWAGDWELRGDARVVDWIGKVWVWGFLARGW